MNSTAKENEPETKRRRKLTTDLDSPEVSPRKAPTRPIAAVTPPPKRTRSTTKKKKKKQSGTEQSESKDKSDDETLTGAVSSPQAASEKTSETATLEDVPLASKDTETSPAQLNAEDGPVFSTPKPVKKKANDVVEKPSSSVFAVTPEASKTLVANTITTTPDHTPTVSPTAADSGKKRKRDEEQESTKSGLYGRGATICIAASMFAVAVASTSTFSAARKPMSSPLPRTPSKGNRYGSYRPLRQRKAVRPKLTVRPPSAPAPSVNDEKVKRQPFRNLMDVIKKVKSASGEKEGELLLTLPGETDATGSLRATLNSKEAPEAIGDGSSETNGQTKTNPVEKVQKVSKKLGDGLVNVARCVAGKCINDLAKHIKERAEERKSAKAIE
eukprot:CAMPEP_0195282294 /NCGR_PEP_ID=MMETSP0707-20130614/1230_1 /TAXON_ID=33640 /ORGANISM="Asterionellopsis glacialis, Strain CCMP134" /LENGTH=385 /DNA_ID=CAMNT_0040341251 /DNA_START=20 /DNA_END=1180 /DNA_ORIENTATION=-